MAFGWGDVVGKIADWFPGRIESLKNQKNKLEREINEIFKKERLSRDDISRIATISDKLREVEDKLDNR